MSKATDKILIKTTNSQISILLNDVMCLARFALETGQVPKQVQLASLYGMWARKMEQSIELTPAEVSQLTFYYQHLEAQLSPVSAASLAATDCQGYRDCLQTEAGYHTRRLWILAFFVVALIVALNLFQYGYEFYSLDMAKSWTDGLVVFTFGYWAAVHMTPFTYGALGACVYVLRVTEQRLQNRTFDPKCIPQHRNRLVLGTLSGGVIVLFIKAGEASTIGVELTAAALGFLAGYSIEFLFTVLDRLILALSPGKEINNTEILRQPPLENQVVLPPLSNNENEKVMVPEMLKEIMQHSKETSASPDLKIKTS